MFFESDLKKEKKIARTHLLQSLNTIYGDAHKTIDQIEDAN
jgi:hypothetical protein